MTDAVADTPAAPAAPDLSNTEVLLSTEAAPVALPVPVAAPNMDTGTPVEYAPTGDVGMDMALEFMGKAGLGTEHPAMQAAMQGDFTILEAVLAQKGVQGYEKFVALGKSAYERSVENQGKANAAIAAAAHKAAGGEAEWNAVRAWAGANATDEEKTSINTMLNAGGVQAKSAVSYLVDAYNRANNVEVNPENPTAQAGRGGVPVGNNAPLDSRAYSVEVQKLSNRLNGRIEGSKEYAQLQQRRLAHRG